jgi:hypothetical protein
METAISAEKGMRIRPPHQVTYGQKDSFVYYGAVNRALAEQKRATIVASMKNIANAISLVKMLVREGKVKLVGTSLVIDEEITIEDRGLTGDRKTGIFKDIKVTNLYIDLQPVGS